MDYDILRARLGYCSMAGHDERGCDTLPQHMALMREGLGISNVPGPTDAELAAEVRNDPELSLDEFHGWAPGELMEVFGS